MKISLEWLRDYVKLREKVEALKEDLTLSGLVVESVGEYDGDGVLELEVTSNRPDCLNHVGVAREVAALYRRRLTPPPIATELAVSGGGSEVRYSIEIRDPELCPRYTGLLLDGVRVGPSPPWLARRLEAAGMRPLNNIVDITNYVLLEMGHPLHAFDFDRLRGGRIVVARAEVGQKMKTLDGVERELDREMLLINDGAGPVAIAGVMGGLESEISPKTRRVLIECAYFQPASIRRTSKKLGLQTEASYRFERGADWDDTVAATARVSKLMTEIAGGRVAGSLQDVYPVVKPPVRIELDRRRAEALIGVKLGDRFIRSTLERLEFKLEPLARGRWLVTVPTFRADMELENDLIEELARFYGYERIPVTQPPARSAGVPLQLSRDEAAARRLLLGLGFNEAINLSFADEADHARFPPPRGGTDRVPVANPLTEETAFLRTTLASGLVRATRHNFNHGSRVVRLFEIGKVYELAGSGDPRERTILGIVATGDFAGRNWRHPAGEYTFFDLKGALSALLDGLRVPSWDVLPDRSVSWLDPSSAARLIAGDDDLGMLGALHPDLVAEYKLKQDVYVAELDFQALARQAGTALLYEPLPRYPAVERDLSIVVGADAVYGMMRDGIRALGIPQLAAIDLIDVYEGPGIAAGKRSLTLRLVFQDRERTLTVDQVQAFSDNVLTFLRDNCGAELR